MKAKFSSSPSRGDSVHRVNARPPVLQSGHDHRRTLGPQQIAECCRPLLKLSHVGGVKPPTEAARRGGGNSAGSSKRPWLAAKGLRRCLPLPCCLPWRWPDPALPPCRLPCLEPCAARIGLHSLGLPNLACLAACLGCLRTWPCRPLRLTQLLLAGPFALQAGGVGPSEERVTLTKVAGGWGFMVAAVAFYDGEPCRPLHGAP